jgi:hypothetical protein
MMRKKRKKIIPMTMPAIWPGDRPDPGVAGLDGVGVDVGRVVVDEAEDDAVLLVEGITAALELELLDADVMLVKLEVEDAGGDEVDELCTLDDSELNELDDRLEGGVVVGEAGSLGELNGVDPALGCEITLVVCMIIVVEATTVEIVVTVVSGPVVELGETEGGGVMLLGVVEGLSGVDAVGVTDVEGSEDNGDVVKSVVVVKTVVTALGAVVVVAKMVLNIVIRTVLLVNNVVTTSVVIVEVIVGSSLLALAALLKVVRSDGTLEAGIEGAVVPLLSRSWPSSFLAANVVLA